MIGWVNKKKPTGKDSVGSITNQGDHLGAVPRNSIPIAQLGDPEGGIIGYGLDGGSEWFLQVGTGDGILDFGDGGGSF